MTDPGTPGCGPGQERVPQVVFACVRNGGRSVIARVLPEHYAQGRMVALSAGTQPGGQTHPEVATALGGQDETTIRRIIVDLDTRVRSLLRELVPDLHLPPTPAAMGSGDHAQ